MTLDNIIEEISMDKINKIVERTAVIIEISRKYKDFIFPVIC